MPKDRIPSSRTSKAAGIEIGVEAFEEAVREVENMDFPTLYLREVVAHKLTRRALALQKRATRALRGAGW